MSKKISILSIDGGGIRGIIPAVILEHIEQNLQKKTRNQNVRLADYFDMIAGTSTGGILTCFYLHPSRLPAEKAVKLYTNNGKKIFKSKFSLLNCVSSLFIAKYSEKGLETALNDALGDCKLSQVSKHSLITAYDIVKRESVFFTVPEAQKKPDESDIYLKDVARATSAAPTYFKPASVKVGNQLHSLIDGGMFANDPSLCAMVEARKTDFEKHKHPTIKNLYIVSVGTGKISQPFDPKKASNWGIAGWASPVIDILTMASPEVVSYQLKQLFDVAGCSDYYMRLEPELCKASPAMDDITDKNIENLKDAGNQYIKQNKEKLDKIVDELLLVSD